MNKSIMKANTGKAMIITIGPTIALLKSVNFLVTVHRSVEKIVGNSRGSHLLFEVLGSGAENVFSWKISGDSTGK